MWHNPNVKSDSFHPLLPLRKLFPDYLFHTESSPLKRTLFFGYIYHPQLYAIINPFAGMRFSVFMCSKLFQLPHPFYFIVDGCLLASTQQEQQDHPSHYSCLVKSLSHFIRYYPFFSVSAFRR